MFTEKNVATLTLASPHLAMHKWTVGIPCMQGMGGTKNKFLEELRHTVSQQKSSPINAAIPSFPHTDRKSVV